MPHWKTIVRADSKFLTLADIAGMTPLKVTVVKVTTETAHNPGDHTDGLRRLAEIVQMEFTSL